jgi:ABC-2 type transport system permease protein
MNLRPNRSASLVDSLLRIVALVRKELLAVLKDRRSRNSLLLPSIVQCLIYGYVATYDLTDVPYAVIDQDRSASSREVLARLDGSGVFRRVAEPTSLAEAKRLLDDRRVLLVLQLEQDFERNVHSGRPARLQVLADGRNSNTAGTSLGYVSTIVEAFNAEQRRSRGLPDAPAVDVTLRAWYNPNLETRWYMLPSLVGTLTFMQTLMLTAMSVAREREEGTFDQLLATPFRPTEIVAGKAGACMLIGVVQATNVLLVAQLWFHVPFAGSFAVLYAGLVLFLLSAVGFGLFLSSIARTMQQAMFYGMLFMNPFALLSGLTTPIGNMPRALQYLTLVNPLRYAIEITQRVYLEGAGIELLIPDLWPMAAIAGFTLTVSAWMFRRGLG